MTKSSRNVASVRNLNERPRADYAAGECLPMHVDSGFAVVGYLANGISRSADDGADHIRGDEDAKRQLRRREHRRRRGDPAYGAHQRPLAREGVHDDVDDHDDGQRQR